MSTEFFIASQLGALLTPVLAVVCSQIAFSEKWQSKLLIVGHITAFVFAIIALVSVFCQSVSTQVVLGDRWLELQLDPASSCVIAAITLISAVVIAFSERYLGGDKTRQSFLCILSLLSSTAAVLAVSDSLPLSIICWHLLSLGLWRIMCLQPDSREAASVVLRHHLLSDALLLAALVIVMSCSECVTFSELPQQLGSFNGQLHLLGLKLPLTIGNLICLLLILSFSIKSALFPFHRWLLATLDAPTPLSGLLHAGIVNVSAVVAYRMMPVLNESPVVLLLWGGLAAISVVIGTLSMSAQPDVKRKLVYSTVGQMGFMSLQCAAGALGFALFHLLAHGLFKCHMFLQSGSAVAEGLAKRRFAYTVEAKEGKGKKLRNLVFILATALGFCCALLIACPNSGWKAISAIIAATAILCAVPAVNRVSLNSLALFWFSVLGLASASALGNVQLEKLLQTEHAITGWLLPLCLASFAVIAMTLSIARKSRLASALYVHSLNGFYTEEITSAFSNWLRVRRNSH